MTRLIFTLGFTLFTSMVSMTLSATELHVSDNLVLTEIDNKIIDNGFIDKESTFTLNRGQHAIIVHYKDVFEDMDFGEEKVIKSQAFVVKFIVNQEQQLNLTTHQIKNLAQAESFSKSPELSLVDENNNAVQITLQTVENYKIAQQVNIAVTDYKAAQDVIETKPVLTKPKVVQQPRATVPTASQKTQKKHNGVIKVSHLTMLKYWWQNASTEEKQFFKTHILREIN